MGIGPAPAIRALLDRAQIKLGDVQLFEVNEAFAPQYLAVEKDLGLPRDLTNVDGGAIAVGHPLAASGARITLHLLYELKRRGAQYGIGQRLHRWWARHRSSRGGHVTDVMSEQEAEAERERAKQETAKRRAEAKVLAEARRNERKNRKRKCVMCHVEESEKTPFFAHPDGIGPACKEPGVCEHYRATGKPVIR